MYINLAELQPKNIENFKFAHEVAENPIGFVERLADSKGKYTLLSLFNLILAYSKRYKIAYMSQMTLARRLGITRQWVNRLIAYFIDLGFMALAKKRWNNSNIYIINPWFWSEQAGATLGYILSALQTFRLSSLFSQRLRFLSRRRVMSKRDHVIGNPDSVESIKHTIKKFTLVIDSNKDDYLNNQSINQVYIYKTAREALNIQRGREEMIFSNEQLLELKELGLSNEAMTYARKKMTDRLMSGHEISNQFAYFKTTATNFMQKQVVAREPLAQDSAGASSKGSSGHTEAASKALSARESVRYEASDLPYLKETCESTAKIVAESSRTYVKAQTEINLRLLDAAKRNHSFFMRKFHETCKAFSIDPATVKTRHEMLPPAPLNATGAIFAKELGALMPDSVKEELNALRKSTPDHKEIKNNVVLHSILDAYESGKLVQQSIIGNDMPSAKPTILRE